MQFLNTVLDFFGQMFLYALIAIFLENSIFSRALGASTSLWMIRKKYNLFLFGLVLTVITTLSSLLAYFTLPLFQKSENSYYWAPLVFVCIISVVYIAALLLTNRIKLGKAYKSTILMFIHRCAFNCAVLGALLLGMESNLTLGGFIGFGIGTGLGFTFATWMVHLVSDKLNSKAVPRAFRGFPITLIYIGILSLAVYGLIGHELPV